MIVKKTLKNGKCSVTSSYFEDIRLLKASLRESMQDDYVPSKWRREKGRDFSELKLATATQCLILAKRGAEELSDFVANLKQNQYDNYKINYGPWQPYESYETLVGIRDELLAKDKLDADEQKELDRVTKEIKGIDDFVEQNVAAVASSEEVAE